MTQSNLLFLSLSLSLSRALFLSSDSIEKRIHKAKRENLSIERHSRLYSFFASNLEQLFETGRYRIKRDITSILKTVCVRFFLLFSLSRFFSFSSLDSHLDYICIFCFFFSSNLLFKYTFTKQSNPERTLNCNDDDERDSA